MISRHSWQSLLLCVLLTVCSNSIGITNLRIDDLVNTSDVIAVAEVSEVKTNGLAPPVLFRNQLLDAKLYSNEVAVKRTIKGVTSSNNIVVRYSLPTSFVGYRGLRPGIRLIFLRVEHGDYTIADPYYPDLPAVLALKGSNWTQPMEGDYGKAVVRELLAVVASDTASSGEKSEVLHVEYALPRNDAVVAALKDGLSGAHEPDLRQRLQGELISRGDLSELQEVANLLLSNAATENQKIWLLYVIGNQLNDKRAIVTLQPLLRSSDGSIRGAATEALWHIADPVTLPDLAQALRDPDEQVRFYAVRAFSDIAGESGWGGPSEPEFHEHQQKYLAHWSDWAKSRGQ